MASIDTLVCATNCSSQLPVVDFDACSPVILQAQVSTIFIANDGYPLIAVANNNELLQLFAPAAVTSPSVP